MFVPRLVRSVLFLAGACAPVALLGCGSSTAEVSGADQQDAPDLVGAEDALDLGDQIIDAVADAGVAEGSEVGEILADLSISEAEDAAKLRRTGRLVAVADQVLQFPEVQAQSADDGLGNYVMLSVDRADFGRVYFEDHELPQEDNSELNSQFLIAETLEEFLEGLTYDPEDAST